MYNNYYNDNRFIGGGFLFPFLVGSVAGGAAIGLTRPRPVYVNQPYYQPYGYSYYYGYQRPF